MELKRYQKNVIDDLQRFLNLLTEKQNIAQAYNALWQEKGVGIGPSGMEEYHTTIPGVPHVCLKIPTGGGKTFIASCSVKPVFDAMPNIHPKAVVWLVPSDAILTQTIAALQNVDHPYRRRLNADFSSNVEVYTKEQLLNGQNFDPVSVDEQLSVFVVSYDSFRTNKKEGRKVYQENGYLTAFSKYKADRDFLLKGTDENALIQVIRKLNPVLIVDESHHATSKLSVEMLENFNPAFILELTATPRKNSNIISYVQAAQLKLEQMIKLPVIVCNRRTQNDVFIRAIALRQKLEEVAKQEEEVTGRYIRPLVLFQAEPKTKDESTTYEKIKNVLLEAGIPEEHIAVKTADKDDIKKQDLLSKDCKIRYIITVNALKEGWDCPFAYILATVANRSSAVDVEQILGRILRMPNAKANKSDILNLSYVITSSANFLDTCDKVVKGLNAAGFSSKDYRTQDDAMQENEEEEQPAVQMDLDSFMSAEPETSDLDIERLDTELLASRLSSIISDETDEKDEETLKSYFYNLDNETSDILQAAKVQENTYWETLSQQGEDGFEGVPEEVKEKMKTYFIKTEFMEEALQLEIPQFVVESQPTLFAEKEYTLLEKEALYDGFTLKDKDTQIDFNVIEAELARVDVETSGDGSPKAFQLKGYDNIHVKEWFDVQPSEKKRRLCKDMICNKILRIKAITTQEVDAYVGRIMENMSEDQLTDLEQSYYPYLIEIEKKIKSLLSEYAALQFRKLLEQERIFCKPTYHFPKSIAPLETISSIPKSLYAEEEQFDTEYERKVAWELSALDNIKWWHRNIAKRGFAINGDVPAYPDLIVMTTSGKILLIETKGDQLKNDESKIKAEIGAKWAAKASLTGRTYKYYMVFQKKDPDYDGACSYERFMEIVREL